MFDTYSAFYEDHDFICLQSQGCENGIRFLIGNKKDHIVELIKKNAEFLHREIQQDGRFIYGYFPAYKRN
ncbi:hypothetical protein J517_4004 [Acinetobacter baumannii 118362]|nr:hypothetical protein J517_4004 [Acinetobacter baumannii 118362]